MPHFHFVFEDCAEITYSDVNIYKGYLVEKFCPIRIGGDSPGEQVKFTCDLDKFIKGQN